MSNIDSVKKWTVVVEEDPVSGDLIITLPEDLMTSQKWESGDTLSWSSSPTNEWTLTKVAE